MDPIQAILQGASQSDTALSKGIDSNNAAASAMEQLFRQSATSTGSAINAAADANRQQAGVGLAQGKLAENIQSLYGLNLSDPTNVLAGNLKVIKDSQEAQRQAEVAYAPARAEYDSAASVGLLDNPFQYIMNQIKLPQLAAKVNSIDAARERSVDLENQAVQRNMQALQGEAAAKSTLVANTADAEFEVAMKRADAQAIAANAELQRHQAEDVARVAATRLQSVTLADKRQDNLRQAAVSVAQLRTAAENHTLHVEQMKDAAINRQLKTLALEGALEDKQRKRETDAAINARLSVASASLGRPDAINITTLKLLPKDVAAGIESAAFTGRYGNDLQSSLDFYLSQGGADPNKLGKSGMPQYVSAQLMQESAEQDEWRTNAMQSLIKTTGSKTHIKEEEITALAYKMYQANLVQTVRAKNENAPSAVDPAFDRLYNPYKLPYVAAAGLIASGKNETLAPLKDNIFQKYVQARLTAGPVQGNQGNNLSSTDLQAVFTAMVSDATIGKVSVNNLASQIAEYTQRLSQYQYDTVKPDLFALPRPSNYYVNVQGQGLLGSGQSRVDFTDTSQLENYLTRAVVQRRSAQQTMTYDPLGNPTGLGN